MNRYELKAENVVAAYRARYNAAPTKHAVAMVCAVAEHETNCGDAWDHSGNWGAVQRRVMTAAEKISARAGIPPLRTDPFEEIHGDSSPINGKYKTWFWCFPPGVIYEPAGLAGDDAGAWMLLGVLLEQRHSIKPVIDTVGAPYLAELMYRSGYYEGFHDPRGVPGPDGLTAGEKANITDYSHAITGTLGAFTAGLKDWWPDSSSYPNEEPGYTPLFSGAVDIYGMQCALNVLHAVDPPLKEDGIMGPKTSGAIKAWQAIHALSLTGELNPATTRSVLDALP